jgi:uncharacterized membrane protein YGL010W
MKIKLNRTWTRLMDSYKADHQNVVNQKCHSVGIPLIAGSLPVGATLVGLPLAAGMFSVGWTFQFVGHAFERKKPSFVDDRRALLVGLLWWLEKSGLAEVEQSGADDAVGGAVAPAA